MNLSKPFNCIAHDLVNAKSAAYGFNIKSNTTSVFEEIISGVPQGSIVGSILFKIFFNNSFYFIVVSLADNFGDENTLSGFAKTIKNLISILESESEIVMNWFKGAVMEIEKALVNDKNIFQKHLENFVFQLFIFFE